MTTGLGTTFLTNRTIFTDSDSNDDEAIDKKVENSFDSFKKLFRFSKHDDKSLVKQDTPDNNSLMINELKQRENYQAPKYVCKHILSSFNSKIILLTLSS